VTFDTPSLVTTIPSHFFYGCGLLETVTLPDSVTTIARSAFLGSRVTSIIGPGLAIIADLVVLLGTVCCRLRTPSSVRIPGNVREIGYKAFSHADSLSELSFEEGVLKVGVSAFSKCWLLKKVAFPASLLEIDANAFQGCVNVGQITFAVGSRLQYIRSKAFSGCSPNGVVIPASVVEIDPSAFCNTVWRSDVRFEGRPIFWIAHDFLRSVDSRVVYLPLWYSEVSIESTIEVIGANAFESDSISKVRFKSGTRLREIGSRAFSRCHGLNRFKVPESVEVIGDRCFEHCRCLETIEFERSSRQKKTSELDFYWCGKTEKIKSEGPSRLKKIGERAFAGCNLHSITIPASTEEIDGSAFVNCPLIEIRVAAGSLSFKTDGDLLVTSNGTEIVRYFGRDREITLCKTVKILGKSCFEGCKYVDRVDFAIGSELVRIGPAALRDCVSLTEITVPPSIEIIDKASFEGCSELESCSIAPDSELVTIGSRAFAKCTSLRSFSIPALVGGIGKNCFDECIYLYRLRFQSSESLKRILGDGSLDDALEEFGVSEGSGLFRLEVDDGGAELNLPGWISVYVDRDDPDEEEARDLQLTLVRDIQ
jgi:hypothetical protein